MAKIAMIKSAIPAAKLLVLKAWAKIQIPKNMMLTPAIRLKVETLIKGNKITIKPNSTARIPTKTFFVSVMVKISNI